MLALFCAMSCVFVLSAMVPMYLVNVLQLTPAQMGVVTSAIGFGGFFGQFGWPGLSDRFGRKPLAILGFVGATASVWWFANTGASVVAVVRRVVRLLVLLPRQCRADHGPDRDGVGAARV